MKKGLFQVMGQLLVMALFASVTYAEFGLLLGSFRSRDNAENYAAKIVSSLIDYPCNAFVEETSVPGTGFWYRVCLGPFVSKKQALIQKQILYPEKIATDMIVVKTKADASAVSESLHTPDPGAKPVSSPGPVKAAPISDVKTGTDIIKGTKDITLTWDAQKDPTPTGYRIYYDTKPGPPYNPSPADYAKEGPPPVVVKGDITTLTLHGLAEDKDYFFAITAFDSLRGTESSFSNEIAARSESQPSAGPPPASSSGKNPKDEESAKSKEIWVVDSLSAKSDSERPDTSKEEMPGDAIPAELSADTHDSDLLAAGDTLEIDVPGQKEMSMRYDVAPDGNIYMMSVGRISVQGLSPLNLERGLTEQLRRFVEKGENLSIKLVKKERYVQITGGVRYPGWYRVAALDPLDKLIETAGGFLEGVKDAGIKVRRESADGYREFQVGKGKLALHPNDMVIVPSPDVYQKKVDAGDLLFINVPGRGEGKDAYLQDKVYKLNQFEVDNNGYVYIPDVGHVYVKDLTTGEIKEAIAKKLPKYLARDSKMDVSIIEKRQYVQVLGHVANPGVYVVKEGSNVQAALNVAGGAVDGAVMSDARILRKRGEETERIPINLYQFTITGDPRLLTPLHENDVLFVPISPNFGNIKRTLMPWTPPPEKLEEDVKNKVRIFGAVKDPGTYEPKEDMSLVDLIIAAGGETNDADLSKVLIVRKGNIDEVFNLQLFFNRESDEPLPKIKNGDTVYIRFRELTIFEPEEEKVFYVLGEVRSPNQYKLADNMTLFQAVSLAGGFTEWADTENITIVRMVNGKQENFRYSLENGIAGRVPEWNTYIYPGDTIYVP